MQYGLLLEGGRQGSEPNVNDVACGGIISLNLRKIRV